MNIILITSITVQTNEESLNYDSDDELDKHEMGIAAESLASYKGKS